MEGGRVLIPTLLCNSEPCSSSTEWRKVQLFHSHAQESRQRTDDYSVSFTSRKFTDIINKTYYRVYYEHYCYIL